MTTCSVVDCHNSFNQNQESLSFHRFPIKNEELTQLWLTECKIENKKNIKNLRVCSAHFHPDDFKRDLKNELLNLPTKKILKENVVPSVFSARPSSVTNTNKNQLKNKERVPIRKRKRLVNALLLENDDNNKVDFEELYKQACTKIKKCEEELNEQKQVINQQADTLTKMNSTIKTQKDKIKNLKSLLQTSKSIFKKKNIKTTTASILSTAQEKRLKGFKKVRWSVEDIVTALKVRSVSLKAYETTLSTWKIPLPSVRTLNRWIRNFDCREGILTDVLKILKEKSKDLDQLSRIVVICFDEMSLHSKHVLDPTLNKISSHSKVQVVMIRSLFDDWKQPVYFKFNTDVTKPLLFDIITQIENCNLKVCAVISDLGRENQSLLNDLKIKEGNVRFQNPVDSSRHVHIITDIPHCLKNMKNHVIDDSVLLEDGTIINKESLLQMARQNGNGKDHKIHPHFTEQMLNLSGAERMRVEPAARFFSHSSSNLASEVFPDNPSISEFFEIFNNGFDVLNSRVENYEGNNLKSGLGTFFEEQKTALLKLKSMLSSMRFKTPIGNIKKIIPSQMAFIISIESTLLLFEELKSLYSIPYLLTSRLTQDCLESFFSVVRSLSGQNTHPDAPNFRYRLRLILLGSRFKAPRGSNTQGENLDFSYLSSDLIRLNKLERKIVREEDVEPALDFNVDSQESETEQEHELESTEVEEQSLRQISYYLFTKLNKDGSLLGELESSGSCDSSNVLLSTVKILEREFLRLFPLLGKVDFAITKMSNKILQNHSSISTKLVKLFLNIRMRMKVRSLNEERKSQQQASRKNRKKAKEFSKSSKPSVLVNKTKKHTKKSQPKKKK